MKEKECVEKVEFTYTDILKDLTALELKDKPDIHKIANIFGRVQELKECPLESIEELFVIVREKVGDNLWKFLIEVYSRFYMRTKMSEIIPQRITAFIEKELIQAVSEEVLMEKIDECIDRTYETKSRTYLKAFWESLKKQHKGSEQYQKNIAVMYVVFLIRLKKKLPFAYKEIITISIRSFVEIFSDNEKNADIYYLKTFRRAFLDDKLQEKANELIGLYYGLEDNLEEARAESKQRYEVIQEKLGIIATLKSENDALKQCIVEKDDLIRKQQDSISALEKDVRIADEVNGMNKNIYNQQVASLESSILEDLQEKLKLELEGLESILNTLTGSAHAKLNRRIENIKRIIQKMGK